MKDKVRIREETQRSGKLVFAEYTKGYERARRMPIRRYDVPG